MLPKDFRLRAGEDFEKVFRQGKPFFLGEITSLVFFRGAGTSRIGVAFQKKNFPRASSRHFYKRKMLAALSPHLQNLPQGLDIILLFQKKPNTETFSFFEKKSEDLLKRLNQAKINV